MDGANKDYELQVLKIAISKQLDEIVSTTEQSLKQLQVERDQIVWQVATKIYSQSGHKVEFSLVRDIVNARIERLRRDLEEIKQIQQQEEARKAAEVRRKQEEAYRQAEEERKAKARELDEAIALFGDKQRALIFLKVRSVLFGRLDVDETKIKPDSHIANDLGADELDIVELVMGFEEEFDIEITDQEASDKLNFGSYPSSWNYCSWESRPPRYSGESLTVTACTVETVVNFIHQKLPPGSYATYAY
uniref:Acyl carrier protein n=1 Tax=Cyanothece sp. (strain PCC 7425 / ATCC 29141) TaxID=395961 RepID=B8HMG9_CYAP4